MIRIVSSVDGSECELSGSPSALGDIGRTIIDWVASDSSQIVIEAHSDFDPAPYDVVLRKLTLRLSGGPIQLTVQNGGLDASGSRDAFMNFATWFQCPSDTPDGHHVHFDNV